MIHRPLSRLLLFCTLLVSSFNLLGQIVENPISLDSSFIHDSCEDINQRLRIVGDSVLHHADEPVRMRYHRELEFALTLLLENHADPITCYTDSLPTLSVLESSDKRVILVTWVIPDAENQYRYGGVVRYRKGGVQRVMVLHDQHQLGQAMERQKIEPDQWYGALYYDLIQVGRGKKRHYIVLGWDQYTPFANQKVIDGITWDDAAETIYFAAPLVNGKGTSVNRLIFGYREDASVSVRYHYKEKRLVWDHLSAIDGAPGNMPEFMVPDFSYDGLKYKRGKWRFLNNIAPKNERE